MLFSACLLGHATAWEGDAYTDDLSVRLARLSTVRAHYFCPENATLGTPRPLTTLYDGHGRDVLAGRARVLETTGRDVTAEIVRGANAMLEVARRNSVELAVMLDVSDSCGSHAVYLGAPDERRYQQGPGVAAATLMNAGIPVLAQRDNATMHRLVAALDPSFTSDPSAFDFVDHPMVPRLFRRWPGGHEARRLRASEERSIALNARRRAPTHLAIESRAKRGCVAVPRWGIVAYHTGRGRHHAAVNARRFAIAFASVVALGTGACTAADEDRIERASSAMSEPGPWRLSRSTESIGNRQNVR